jgi:hypothetical protein
MHAVRGDPRNFIESRQAGIDFQPLAKTFGKRGLYDCGKIRHRTLLR